MVINNFIIKNNTILIIILKLIYNNYILNIAYLYFSNNNYQKI